MRLSFKVACQLIMCVYHKEAAAVGVQVQLVDVPAAGGLKAALSKAVRQRAQALLVGDCPSGI